MELGSLQSRLLVQMEQARFLPLLLTLAENADKGEYEEYNVLVLDSLWLIFRAVEVEDLIRESSQVSNRLYYESEPILMLSDCATIRWHLKH